EPGAGAGGRHPRHARGRHPRTAPDRQLQRAARHRRRLPHRHHLGEGGLVTKTKSSLAVNRQLKDALTRQAQRTGERTPAVRGADWRLATVTAVPGDGLIEVDGDMTVRHLATYATPAEG